jgi:ubiquinone/menaquinone biosynthesis C-methylase UbiE
MQRGDVAFGGSVPELYERHLGPMFFEPYARDIVDRALRVPSKEVLETAAGTGQVTRLLADALPAARIIATDLNAAMLMQAKALAAPAGVTWETADMQMLPFPDGAFDLVLCQFGVMFVPDQVTAFREARRVLAPGGRYLFNVWASVETNEIAKIAAGVLKTALGSKETFIERVPHGYGDTGVIEQKLRDAGFTRITIDSVKLRSRAPSARDAALGIVQGTPAQAEIVSQAPERLPEITAAVERALTERFGDGAIDGEMHAFVVEALRDT